MLYCRSYVFGLVLLLAISLAAAQSGPCPEIYTRYSNQHTYCLLPNPTCQILQQGISGQDRDTILRRHNEWRSKVAMGRQDRLPTASDMLQMEWDDEMARVAQKLANRCKYGHDCSECRQTTQFEPGQNLGLIWISSDQGPLPNIQWERIIDAWCNEVKDFNPKSVDSLGDGHTGVITHFTQAIWSKSWKIGCGYAVYRKNGGTYSIYACNYGLSGNHVDKPVYIAGRPYTNCPINSCRGPSCLKRPNYEGLCQITGNGGPKYPRDPRFTFLCDFEDDNNLDCLRHQTTGVGRMWQVSKTLSGSFIGMVLNPGETSTLVFSTPMKGNADQACLVITYRMGPNVAGDEARGKTVATVVDSTGYSFNMRFGPSHYFVPYTMGIGWKSEFRVSFTFEVPQGAQRQYFEVSEISFRDGKCR